MVLCCCLSAPLQQLDVGINKRRGNRVELKNVWKSDKSWEPENLIKIENLKKFENLKIWKLENLKI